MQSSIILRNPLLEYQDYTPSCQALKLITKCMFQWYLLKVGVVKGIYRSTTSMSLTLSKCAREDAHIKNIEKIKLPNFFGLWWWSSSQRACLLL